MGASHLVNPGLLEGLRPVKGPAVPLIVSHVLSLCIDCRGLNISFLNYLMIYFYVVCFCGKVGNI